MGFSIAVDLMHQVLKVGAKEPEMDRCAFFFRIDAGSEIIEYGSAFFFGQNVQKGNYASCQFQILSDIDGFVIDAVYQTF
jgi:hypothetical protein